MSWREDTGIHLYVNGAIVGKEASYRYLINEYQPFDGLTIGCNIVKAVKSFGKFYLAMITFSPMFSSIDEIMKLSPPLVIRPTFDWFLMLIQNGTTLTTPPLHVYGGVRQTENGILFDGTSGWMDAGSLEG